MRNAALILGVFGGIWGMIVGFFGYGYTVVLQTYGDSLHGIADQVHNVDLIRAASLIAPMLAIAGGGMARSRNFLGGWLMLASAVGMHWAFGFGVFTMFPIAFCALGGLLALLAHQPDPH